MGANEELQQQQEQLKDEMDDLKKYLQELEELSKQDENSEQQCTVHVNSSWIASYKWLQSLHPGN